MKLLEIIEIFRTKRVKQIAYGVLILLVVVDIFIPRNVVHFFGDEIPGFWSFFGLIACVLIIVISKWIGPLGLMHHDNYYDEGDV